MGPLTTADFVPVTRRAVPTPGLLGFSRPVDLVPLRSTNQCERAKHATRHKDLESV